MRSLVGIGKAGDLYGHEPAESNSVDLAPHPHKHDEKDE